MSEFEAEKSATGKSPCDCGCGDCGDKAKPAVVEAQPDNSRRKLLFGGVVATPAIVMLSSRSALAGGGGPAGWGCSISAHASVNLSKPQYTDCKSLSPGCWKNTRNWPSPFNPGLPNPLDGNYTIPTQAQLQDFFKNKAKCTTSDATATAMAIKWGVLNGQATLCTSYFPWAASGLTFMQALQSNSQLIRKSVCCVLNAAQFGAQAFGYTVAEIVALINQRVQANDATLLADLDILANDRGNPSCPQDGSGTINWCTVCAV